MKEGAFIVRKATLEDIVQIQQVSKEAFDIYIENAGIGHILSPLNETYEEIKDDIESKMIFVVTLDEIIVGSVRIEIKPDNIGYLSRFGVRREFQNKGIGRILINEVDKAMEELGVKYLYLHTASRLFSLVKFYYGKGFYIESTSRERGYIRALMCKEYRKNIMEDSLEIGPDNLIVI